MIKPRIRWVRHVVEIRKRNVYTILVGNLNGKYPDTEGMIILILFLFKLYVKVWTGLDWTRLAINKFQLWTFVNTLMNVRYSKITSSF